MRTAQNEYSVERVVFRKCFGYEEIVYYMHFQPDVVLLCKIVCNKFISVYFVIFACSGNALRFIFGSLSIRNVALNKNKMF